MRRGAFAAGLLASWCLGASLAPWPCAAQAMTSLTAALLSDYRFRGVSLSDGRTAAQASVNVDWIPAYAGLFASSARLGYEDDRSVELEPYAGWTLQRDGASLDLGAAYAAFASEAEYDYAELHAGIAKGDYAFQVFYSPSYFRGGERTLYMQFGASSALAGAARVFLHAGDLQCLTRAPQDSSGPRSQFDVRVGADARWPAAGVQLYWTWVNRVLDLYPVSSYDGTARAGRSAIVLQVSAFL
jgi:uncharacterized protein (TIGR02001 family)